MKKIRLWILCILLFGIAIIFIGKREIINAYFSTVKLQFITNYTNKHYLYDIEEQMGLEGIYSGYLEGLDNSATYYLNQDDLEAARAKMKGNDYGIGLKLMWNLDGHAMTVTDVIENSPAARENIQVGSHILQVDGIKVLPSNEEEIITKAFSNKSTPIEFIIKEDNGIRKINLTPEEISIKDVTIERINNVLYIKLNSVKEGTSIRLKQMIDEIATNSYEKILLDVRGLATDYLEEVSKISDLFLEGDIAFKEKRKGDNMTTYVTEDGAYGAKMAILMDGTTRGGAEALVLALQDRVILYGSETKGLLYIKRIVEFEDGTGMSVASGKICDRYGKELPKEGIAPDVRLYLDEEEQMSKLINGHIARDEDSYLEAALEKFQ